MIKSYLINLDKDQDRLDSFKRQFDGLDLEFQRIRAVDGRQMPKNEYEAFQQARPRKNKKQWLRGQVGCFLSHHKAWKLIAADQDRFGAIFEDDIYISARLKALLANDGWIPSEVDIIRLEAPPNRVKLARSKLVSHEGSHFFRLLSTSWCTGAYLISREAALKVISLAPEHHEPTDFMLFSFDHSVLAPQLNIAQCNPSPCVQDKFQNSRNSQFFSNIETPNAESAKMSFRDLFKLSFTVLNLPYKWLHNYKKVRYL